LEKARNVDASTGRRFLFRLRHNRQRFAVFTELRKSVPYSEESHILSNHNNQ
jgi:hypothetical protein